MKKLISGLGAGEQGELQQMLAQAMREAMQPVVELEALRRKITVTPEEASRLIGVPAGTLKNWRAAGRGPKPCGEGSKVVYSTAELVQWAARTGRKTVD